MRYSECERTMEADPFALNIKTEQNVSKVSHKFSIESILGLSSHKSSPSSDDATKINRLEPMDFSQKGMKDLFGHHTCHFNDS